MALSKNIVSSEGFVTTYHKVNEVSLRDNVMNCVVNSYVSKEYRELERPADRQFFNFEITVEEEESMGIRQLAYKKIKELEEWADAIDC
jgi:hypothetical protein